MNFVAYYRVSTVSQGSSGLGLEAQRAAVSSYVRSVGGRLLHEYEEIESARSKDRPVLKESLRIARSKKAILVIAKLDRLARNVRFVSSLLESGVEFVAADMPHANKLTMHIISAVAEYEREMIAMRTRDALRAAKAKGVRLGSPSAREQAPIASAEASRLADEFAKGMRPVLAVLRHDGLSSYADIARGLNRRGIATQRGKEWTPTGVRNVVERINRLQTIEM
ncbi:MAG: resolvase [Stenotrophomonas sp. 14-69-23]|nr:MAG: resolvase [Stenotrophomonas sp. 14-69-23]